MYEWNDILEKEPEDKEWVLIAHRDYATPIKALFHSDGLPHFTFNDASGECAEYEIDRGEELNHGEPKVKHWTKLPEMPEGEHGNKELGYRRWYACPYCKQNLFVIKQNAVIEGLQIKCKKCKRIIDVSL